LHFARFKVPYELQSLTKLRATLEILYWKLGFSIMVYFGYINYNFLFRTFIEFNVLLCFLCLYWNWNFEFEFSVPLPPQTNMPSICEKTLGLFPKQLRKRPHAPSYTFIHLPVIMEQHHYHWTDFLEIFYSRVLQKLWMHCIFYCRRTKLILYMRNYI
jgi:hypothetical protein